MSLLDESEKLASNRGYNVERTNNKLTIIHPHVPVLKLLVSLEDNKVVLELEGSEELRDYIDDLLEERGEEEASSIIEEAVDDMNELAAQLEALARRMGFKVENRVRTGALDILEALEDIIGA